MAGVGFNQPDRRRLQITCWFTVSVNSLSFKIILAFIKYKLKVDKQGAKIRKQSNNQTLAASFKLQAGSCKSPFDVFNHSMFCFYE